MLERLKQKDFEEHLSSQFEVTTASGQRVVIELVEVKGKEDERLESFSLLFRGDSQDVFPQATHTVAHKKLGTFPMFVGPVVTGKSDAVYYQAVFNRLKTK